MSILAATGIALLYYAFAFIIGGLTALMIRGIVVALDKVPTRTAVEPTQSTPVRGMISPEPVNDLPVIVAAAYAMLGGRRIIQIEGRDQSTAWAQEGRMLHRSQRVTKRR